METLDISNDQYYKQVSGFKQTIRDHGSDQSDIPVYGSKTIRHSLPAYDLWRPFFPTYLSEEKFRNLHRPKLRHYNTGPQSQFRFKKPKAFPVKNLSRTIYRFQKKLRFKVIKAINDGLSREDIVNKFLLIREAKDLTAKQGELFLFEYSEEYPPVLSQIGMAANVKTIIQYSNLPSIDRARSNLPSRTLSDNHPNAQISTEPGDPEQTQPKEGQPLADDCCHVKSTRHEIGFKEVISNKNTTKQVYYNQLKPGNQLKVIENNLYRAPIYEHEFPSCDFLVVRTRNSFYIRQVNTAFTVGQTVPLVAIPQPTENSISKFRTDLSNNYIHKLFLESNTDPPTLNFETLRKLFPDYHTTALRRRLNMNGATQDQIGTNSIYFRGTSKYGLATTKELRRLTPEQYCLNMAMLAARQRLRELNYTESMINPPNEVELETEVLAAPWNTSKAVLSAMTGRSYLDLKRHLIDPTGSRNEGFSCVSWPKSPTEIQQLKDQQIDAKNRSIQSQPAVPFLDKNPLAYKIKREKLERLAIYQREAQIIAEVQSRVLGSHELLSSDEEEERDEEVLEEENLLDSSFDDQLCDLDRLVVGGRTAVELNFEKEEEERRQMLREFSVSHQKDSSNEGRLTKSPARTDSQINLASFKNKILRITRTYESAGVKIQRTEIVREPKIIALYIKQKGGSIPSSQEANGAQSNEGGYCESRLLSNRQKVSSTRRSSVSLGPSELCRAEGVVVTISKSVLNSRAMRMHRRQYSTEL